MIKLKDRLEKIADLITQGETVADIGTDHGFLPMALRERGISPHVILSDIKEGPLEKAQANIERYFPDQEFDIRIGNGIKTIAAGEVDTVVIAGMGGLLIADILGEALDKAKSFKKLILQPRNAQNKLRAWLLANGFAIEDEALVRERKYICEIILAVPGGRLKKIESESMDLEISPILFEKKDPLLVEFIENKIRIESKVYKAIQSKAIKNKDEILRKTEARIELLQEMRKRRD